MRFAGTISISGATLKALVTEVCESLVSHGFKKLVLLNAHGGNVGILTSATQEFNSKFPEAKVLSLFWLDAIDQEAYSLLEQDLGTHADEVETSLMLKVRKDLVHMNRAKREIPEGLPKDVRLLRKYLGQGVISLQHISKKGALGDPSLASVQKGQELQIIAKRKIIEAIKGAFHPINLSNL
jgi:creatinine amidohydrolase